MPSYLLKMSPLEVVHILRAESSRAEGEPELNTSAEKEYVIEEDFDYAAYGLTDINKFNLVSSVATLNIEGRLEHNYWVLETTVSRNLGPLPVAEESEFARVKLTPGEFEKELCDPGPKHTAVRLHTETLLAKKHFEDWLAETRRMNPNAAKEQQTSRNEPTAGQSGAETTKSVNEPARAGSRIIVAREAVGVFANPENLEAAVDELEISGFDRAAISLLGLEGEAKARIEAFYRKAEDIEDRDVPHAAFTSSDSRVEGEAAAVALPAYVGGVAGAWAAIAAGGALAMAFAAAIAVGIVGAGLGGLLAGAIANRHAREVAEELGKGGIVLWVNVRDADSEKRALAILEQMGAKHVHAHAIQREWSMPDRPLRIPQADPFLEAEPPIDS
jgi:hypothetical protein